MATTERVFVTPDGKSDIPCRPGFVGFGQFLTKGNRGDLTGKAAFQTLTLKLHTWAHGGPLIYTLKSLLMVWILGFAALGLSACGQASFRAPQAPMSSAQAPNPAQPVESLNPDLEKPQETPSIPQATPTPSAETEAPKVDGSNAGSTPAPGPSPTPSKPRPPILSLPGLIPPPDKNDIVETGRLIPTIYYSPIYDEDADLCSVMAKIPMIDMKGNKLIDVCPRTHMNCGFQGSCVIKKNKIQQVYNVIDRIGGQDRFAIVSARCKFGYGVHDRKNRRSFCLEPFVTIAADLDIYSPGDVIFIPSARTLILPSGKMHDGYFIVADAGRLIKGKGRFDFFSGNQHWRDFENPLARIKLHDKNSDHEYHRVEGPEADSFRRSLKDIIAN